MTKIPQNCASHFTAITCLYFIISLSGDLKKIKNFQLWQCFIFTFKFLFIFTNSIFFITFTANLPFFFPFQLEYSSEVISQDDTTLLHWFSYFNFCCSLLVKQRMICFITCFWSFPCYLQHIQVHTLVQGEKWVWQKYINKKLPQQWNFLDSF